MKRFLLGFIALVIVAGTTIFISCKNNNKVKICSDCGKEPDAIEQVTFSLMNKSISSDFYIWKYEKDGNNIESVSSTRADEKLFQFFKNYCNYKNLVFDNQVMAFVLYYNSLVSENLSVTDDNIKGISVYTVKGNKITHSLYLRDENNNFYEEENVKVRVPYITANHIFFYLEKYVFTDTQDKSYIVFSSDFALKMEKNLGKYWAPMVYEIKAIKRIQSNSTQYGSEDKGCAPAPGCENGSWDMICIRTLAGFRCAFSDGPNSPCPATELQQYGGGKYGYAYELGLMYAFRDDFLSNTNKGKKYIENYYYLGEEWKGNLNFELSIQTAEVLIKFNPVMSAFLEPEKHMDEVMFTDDLSEALFSLLNIYEKITKSSEGKEMLNSIRKDINLYKGLTLKNILAMLEKS